MAQVEGRAYKAESGEWSWCVTVDGEEVCRGAGYKTKWEAEADMQAERAEQERREQGAGQ